MGGVKYLSFTTKRKFGAEIEVSGHVEKPKIKQWIEAVDKAHEVKVYENNQKDYGNNHWSVKRDGSCKDKDYPYGFEVATFVGSGLADIALVGSVMTKLRDEGIRVNDNCSVHVHAEVADFSKTQLAKLVAWWMKIEPVVLQMVPKRRHDSIYCVPLRSFHKAIKPDTFQYSASDFWRSIKPPYHDDKNRRVTLNICNICTAMEEDYDGYFGYDPPHKLKKRRTVELRLPEGTTEPRNVMNWIKFFIRFVNLGKNKFSPQDLKALSLTDTLRFLGLHGTDDSPLILSKALWTLKVWFLERIVEFSKDKDMAKEALTLLNFMCSPFRTYDLKRAVKKVRKPVGKGKYSGLFAGFASDMPPQDWLVPFWGD